MDWQTTLSAPLVADLDGDGFDEIIAGGSSPLREVGVFKSDGSPVTSSPWVFLERPAGYIGGGDLDNDGRIEAFFTEHQQRGPGRVHAIGIDGTELPGWPVQFDWGLYAAATLFDLDGDGRLEALLATTWVWGYNSTWLTLLDCEGAVLPGWPIELDESVESGFAIGDLDLDGDLEILTGSHINGGTGEASIYAFNHDGTPYAAESRLATLDAGVVGTPVSLANLTGGPEPEIIACDWDGHIHVFDNQGDPVDGWPPVANFGYLEKMPIALRAAPNEVSALWCSSSPAYVLLYHPDGTLDSHWPWRGPWYMQSQLIVGDLDGDPAVEAFAGGSNPYDWAFELNGNVVNGWPIWTDSNDLGTGILTDLDHDGDTDIVFQGYDSKIHVYDTPGVWDHTRIQASRFMYDDWHTSNPEKCIYREAESANALGVWHAADDTTAWGHSYLKRQGGKSVSVAPDTVGQVLSYRVEIPEWREYQIWARVRGETAKAGALSISIDGRSAPRTKPASASSPGSWIWRRVAIAVLTKGIHEFSLGQAPNNIAIDRWLLTTFDEFPAVNEAPHDW